MGKKGKTCLKFQIINEIKKCYATEYNYVNNILEKSSVPVEEDSSDSENDTIDNKDETDLQNEQTDKKKTERAKSLEELYKKIAKIRDEKYTYRGAVRKKALLNKVKKKKKIMDKKKNKSEHKKNRIPVDNKSMCDSKKIQMKKQNSISVKPTVDSSFNKEGNLVFSKLDLMGETSTVNNRKLLKKHDGNPRKALEKLQKREHFVKKLEERGDHTSAEIVREQTSWANALKKAEGIKVKDDALILKKTLHKKLAKKKVSQKKWEMRLKTVENEKSGRQKKRTENIMKHKQDKLKSKLKKASKKGRIIRKV